MCEVASTREHSACWRFARDKLCTRRLDGTIAPSLTEHTAPKPLLPLDRKGQAYAGGLIAGVGIATGLAIVMHVIQQESPNGFDGIEGSVLLVLFLGVIIGLGLGMGMAAAVPEETGDSAAPHHATPVDEPQERSG